MLSSFFSFFLDNFSFAISARMFCENHPNYIHRTKFPNDKIGHLKLPARWRNVGYRNSKTLDHDKPNLKKVKLRGGEW